MAQNNAAPLARLIEQFERLPGIGRKTAQRLAYSILEQPPERVLYDEGHEFHLPEPKRHRFFRKGKEESVQA